MFSSCCDSGQAARSMVMASGARSGDLAAWAGPNRVDA